MSDVSARDLEGLPWEAPRNFLGLSEQDSALETSAALILPVPYESTTSYGGGTRNGPAAILAASRYIELYDQELDEEPYRAGVATLPALELPSGGPAAAVAAFRAAYDRILDVSGDRFLVTLGGEHSLTSVPVLAWAERLHPRGRRLTVLQFDAHTDLRSEYGGTPFSHAAVMRRVSDQVDIVAVGIRALTSEEREIADAAEHIHLFFADDIHHGATWMDQVLDRLGPDVYITFDVDCFDPSLVPATGTPEPGGLTWYPVVTLLRRVFERRRVLAADIVELAPIPGFHAPDFLVAKLLYKMIGYHVASRSSAGRE